MALIVYWHVGGTGGHMTPPIYPKQLGVSYFMFGLAYSLALETRSCRRVVYNRLFEVYLIGLAFAFLMSAVGYAQDGNPNESNYLPFLFGSNVALNAFPANPTTWFIGTYVHAIVVWAFLLRGVRIRPWMILLAGVLEIASRIALVKTCGLYVAYMALPNWAAVLLTGLYLGQRHERTPAASPVPYLVGFVLLILAWEAMAGPWVAEYSFPFMLPAVGSELANLGLMSCSVTFVYLTFTWMTYQITRRLPAWSVARFFARNSLVIFIAHMPLYYHLRGPLARWSHSHGQRSAIQFVVGYLLLGVVSEFLLRVLQPKRVRDRLWNALTGEVPEDGV